MSRQGELGAPGRILVAEDELLLARAMRRALGRRGYQVDLAANGRDATDLLDLHEYAAVILDLGMPIADGWSVLAHRRTMSRRPCAIVITAQDHRELALQAMRAGASDILPKPIDTDELVDRVSYLLAVATSPPGRAPVVRPSTGRFHGHIVSESPAMREVLALAGRLARSPTTTALLLGESGVGKEVVATFIHEQSSRATGPFVRVNLAALPPTMIEAELFGSMRGAFTGAQQDRIGLLGSAGGGTLLLDELVEFDPSLQPKLLRVLEERRYYPVGSDKQRALDVRILCATNREPQEAIAAGQLRPDLFYRVSTVVVRVPPLRDRREDVLPLAQHFLQQVRTSVARPRLTFRREAEQALLAHAWPGNVRELRNVVERAVIVAETNDIGPADFDLEGSAGRGPAAWSAATGGDEEERMESTPTGGGLASAREDAIALVERQRIVEALSRAGQSTTRAAESLGISRSTLWSKMRRYGISRS